MLALIRTDELITIRTIVKNGSLSSADSVMGPCVSWFVSTFKLKPAVLCVAKDKSTQRHLFNLASILSNYSLLHSLPSPITVDSSPEVTALCFILLPLITF